MLASGLLVAASPVTSESGCRPPLINAVQTLELRYRDKAIWPRHAHPPDEYVRYYWRDRNGAISGQLQLATTFPAKDSGRRPGIYIAASPREVNLAEDGGCSIVNVYSSDVVTTVACGALNITPDTAPQ